ncbi:zinc-dependent metalloprotease [Mumia sp. zg.B53]|uniref:zinc-dependent metalloprotease n=1 Tax=Mumia sp. zg.B53 TaxID=2855449 RepID=UPI001C6F4F68|nr:zinc-dependent metalloprotease [Mumia sp. zg.B53]MBW9215564.1 zinc-dependent metalloprotease [Mumia sp. zg.B53]
MPDEPERTPDDMPDDPEGTSSGGDQGPDHGIGFGKVPGPSQGGTGSPSGDNPFAGTPMEGLFGPFGQMFGGTGGGQMPDMNLLMQQMQRMFAPHDGAVNWELATDVARRTVAASPDPSPLRTESSAVDDAMRLAEVWLDTATDIPAAAMRSAAWSRSEWVESTMPTWRAMVEPIAEHVVAAMSNALPEEAKAMAGPLVGILNQAGGAMFGSQVGQAIGTLATEVLATTDVGLPLGPSGVSALLPSNVRAFGEGLDQTDTDVFLYVALRECAHQRLFAHAPWLRGRLLSTIEEYGRGTSIDVSSIEEKMRGLDPTNLASAQEALEGGLFEPERTPQQQAVLDRLEALLAFIEGWVDEVVTQATDGRMPSAPALREAMRRRRAAGGPAEQTFASLVGLDLRPRRLRDAAALWAALRDHRGAEARDAVWSHPDLMPTAADLDDPLGFAYDEKDPAQGSGDADFDAALADLLEGGSDGATSAPGAEDTSKGDTSEGDTSEGDTSEGEGPSSGTAR